MKKIFLSIVLLIFLFFISLVSYISIIGYETTRFNSLLENRINLSQPNLKINLDKIKIKFNLKKVSFFVTTSNPEIVYLNKKIVLNKIDAYINLNSLLKGDPQINRVTIFSNETKINKIKSIVKYFKPSNFKKFFLNEVEDGEINFNLELKLSENKVKYYEMNGFVKKLKANIYNSKLENTSFIYLIKKDFVEINNLRGLINGIQMNTGVINIDSKNLYKINGEIKSDLKLSKRNIKNLLNNKIIKNLQTFELNGKINGLFSIDLDKTLKIKNYELNASGNVFSSKLNLNFPQKLIFLKKDIETLVFEKTEFDIYLADKKNNKIDLKGLFKINNKSVQKFNFKNVFTSNKQTIRFNSNFDNEIDIPFLNYNTKNKIAKLSSEMEIGKNYINLKNFSLIEDKSFFSLKKIYLKNKKLVSFESISVKTFKDKILNNDFTIKFGKTIEIDGTKYDSSNLTKLFNKNNKSKFLKKINNNIKVNIKEVNTSVSDVISDFTLIGSLKNGNFYKISSKGKFYEDKYLEISLKEEKHSNKKNLEIYSDLPKALLSNYNFFNGLSGGKLLLNTTYDFKNSSSNLIIENFKVKEAPGLVKLLSLADFGGMVDALSGEGLSFEKLEMNFEKDDKILNLKELYAIGPSISILMEGYMDSETELISLRGTMVPAKTLNRFLSKLPVVGDIIIPKEIGEGLFGISFKMKGKSGDLKTSVNPIKTLTPRFIQKALKKAK